MVSFFLGGEGGIVPFFLFLFVCVCVRGGGVPFFLGGCGREGGREGGWVGGGSIFFWHH